MDTLCYNVFHPSPVVVSHVIRYLLFVLDFYYNNKIHNIGTSYSEPCADPLRVDVCRKIESEYTPCISEVPNVDV